MYPVMYFLHTDINEFYTYTLEDSSKSVAIKTDETSQLAEKWESVSPPVPAASVTIAKKIEVYIFIEVLYM